MGFRTAFARLAARSSGLLQSAPAADLAQGIELHRERHNASLARRIGREMPRQGIEKPRGCEKAAHGLCKKGSKVWRGFLNLVAVGRGVRR